MNQIPTPHIEATSKDEIAKVVLMPGDPLRAKKIAETYLEDVKIFNQVRGMLGYTGSYEGKLVSVMGSGMGTGSIGIYAYELYKFYDVDVIIRLGSCGATIPELNILDIVLADRAFSTETFAKEAFGIEGQFIQGSKRVTEIIKNVCEETKIKVTEGDVASDNVFYSTVDKDWEQELSENNIIAGEMEAFALFATAKALQKEAACLLTVSDSRFHEEQNLSSEDRQNAFDDMMLLSLKSAAVIVDTKTP